MSTYILNVQNNSSQDNFMCVYVEIPGVVILAWLVEPCAAGDTSRFEWSMDFGVFWQKTGSVPASVATFRNNNIQTASPSDGSHFILQVRNGFVKLVPDTNGESGSIYIDTDATVGHGVVSTGVTLSGFPVAVVDAYPNSCYNFVTHPTYWLAFGNFVAGKNADISTVTKPVKVEFETGTFELSFVLDQDTTFIQV